MEKIFQMALEGKSRGIKVNEIPTDSILRYADETAILANFGGFSAHEHEQQN